MRNDSTAFVYADPAVLGARHEVLEPVHTARLSAVELIAEVPQEITREVIDQAPPLEEGGPRPPPAVDRPAGELEVAREVVVREVQQARVAAQRGHHAGPAPEHVPAAAARGRTVPAGVDEGQPRAEDVFAPHRRLVVVEFDVGRPDQRVPQRAGGGVHLHEVHAAVALVVVAQPPVGPDLPGPGR